MKSPLTLGVAAGGLLLAHTIIGTPKAEAGWCIDPKDNNGVDECPMGSSCKGPFIWDEIDEKHMGTCIPNEEKLRCELPFLLDFERVVVFAAIRSDTPSIIADDSLFYGFL